MQLHSRAGERRSASSSAIRLQGEVEAVCRAAVGKPALRVPAHAFVRVELGRVGGQVLQVQPRHAAAPISRMLWWRQC